MVDPGLIAADDDNREWSAKVPFLDRAVRERIGQSHGGQDKADATYYEGHRNYPP